MVLKIEDLRKGYAAPDRTRQTVIAIKEFSIGRSEQVALEGASGSGKTTFLNLIAGILRADEGRILIDGEEMTALSESGRDRLRARKVGYIFQTFNLLQGFTAVENVLLGMTFGKGADRERARELLSRVDLNDRADYLPRQLSIGQQQRLAIARALANEPKVVLADEPTGNLDRKRAMDALTLIREVCTESGAALLLVSHDREVLGAFEEVRKLEEINNGCF